jgi:hypothetical protein
MSYRILYTFTAPLANTVLVIIRRIFYRVTNLRYFKHTRKIYTAFILRNDSFYRTVNIEYLLLIFQREIYRYLYSVVDMYISDNLSVQYDSIWWFSVACCKVFFIINALFVKPSIQEATWGIYAQMGEMNRLEGRGMDSARSCGHSSYISRYIKTNNSLKGWATISFTMTLIHRYLYYYYYYFQNYEY